MLVKGNWGEGVGFVFILVLVGFIVGVFIDLVIFWVGDVVDNFFCNVVIVVFVIDVYGYDIRK